MKQTESPAIRAIQEIKKAVIGKDDCIIKVMTAILAGGHILIEDVPGVGKTMALALAFFQSAAPRAEPYSVHAGCTAGRCDGFHYIRKRLVPLNISRGLLCVTCFWRMRSTVPHRRRRLHFWKSWRKEK